MRSGTPWFNCRISFAPVFNYIYCWVHIFVLSPFISWFVCTFSWCIDKLWTFNANQTSMCLDPHVLALQYILRIVPRRCSFCGSVLLFLFHVFFIMIISFPFLAPLWSPVWKGLATWLSCVCFLYFSHVPIRYGTGLYRFLIFAFLFTFSDKTAAMCMLVWPFPNHINDITDCKMACHGCFIRKFIFLLVWIGEMISFCSNLNGSKYYNISNEICTCTCRECACKQQNKYCSLFYMITSLYFKTSLQNNMVCPNFEEVTGLITFDLSFSPYVRKTSQKQYIHPLFRPSTTLFYTASIFGTVHARVFQFQVWN